MICSPKNLNLTYYLMLLLWILFYVLSKPEVGGGGWLGFGQVGGPERDMICIR